MQNVNNNEPGGIIEIRETTPNTEILRQEAELYKAQGVDFVKTYYSDDGQNEWKDPTTSRKVFSEIMKNIKISENDVFMDCGCGLGHVVYLASKIFKKVVGVELLEKVFKECESNLRKLYPNGNDGIELINKSMFDLDNALIDSVNVFYFSSPFDCKIEFRKWMENYIGLSLYRKPRCIYFIYYYPIFSVEMNRYSFDLLKTINTELGKVNIYRCKGIWNVKNSEDNFFSQNTFSIHIGDLHPSFYSAFLHEYIHYLQDTCTYFGVTHRMESDNAIKGKDISKKGSYDLLPTITVDRKYIKYSDETLGSIAIKENMAFLAQKYILPKYKMAGYDLVSNLLESECPFIKGNYIVQFAIEDISMMTDNPCEALIQIIDFLKINPPKFSTQNECASIEHIYQVCETVLRKKNLLKYDSKVDALYKIDVRLDNISKCGKFTNIEQIKECVTHFAQKNYDTRLHNHSIIAKKLVEYKAKSICHNLDNADSETEIFTDVFFKTFGYPIIDGCIEKMFTPHTLTDLGFDNQ